MAPRSSSRGNEAGILAATIIASSMAFIDGTVVNVALPALQSSLGATLANGQWIIEAYELMLAALMLVGGAAGDVFGRRRVFLMGVAVFILASVLCGFSSSVPMLIAARALQGVGGALLVPGSLALLSASFDEQRRGRAIGTWSGFTAITTAFGPVLGGFLIDHASWRYAFFLNVPLALVVVFLTLRYLPESRSAASSTRRIDWAGAVLAAIALGGIVYALIEGQSAGWTDGRVLASLATGILTLPLFLSVERRREDPLLPLRMFHSRDFAGANLLTLLLYAALGGSLFFLPLNLIQVQGYSAAAAGAALLPFVLLMFALSRWAGGLVERFGPKPPLIVGPAVAACGFVLFAVPGSSGTYWVTFFPAAVVLGMGMTVTVAPLTTTVMQAVSADAAGAASGVNNTVAGVAGLLAIAGMGVVMTMTFETQLERGMSEAHLHPTTVEAVRAQSARLAAIEPPATASADARTAVRNIVAKGFICGFRRVMWIAAALAVLSSVTAWLMLGSTPKDAATAGGVPLTR